MIKLQVILSNTYALADSKSKLKVQLTADAKAAESAASAPMNLVLLVDRSTSMTGEALNSVKEAASSIVDELSAEDRLSIVAFGSDVDVLVESQAVSDKQSIKKQIDRLRARGATNVHEALTKGLEQVEKGQAQGLLSRMIFLSDGEATEGETDDELILTLAKKARQMGVAVSTLGVGEDYDEVLLSDMAQVSGGNHYFISGPEQIKEVYSLELARLRAVIAQNVKLDISLVEGAKLKQLNLRYPYEQTAEGAKVSLDEVVAGAKQKCLLDMEIEPRQVGEYQLGEVKLSFDDIISGERRELRGQIMVKFVTEGKKIREGINREVLREWEELNALQELKTMIEMVRDNAMDAKTVVMEIDTKAQMLIKRDSLDLAKTFAEVGKTIAEAGEVSVELVKRTIVACQDKQQGGDGRTLVE